MRSHRILQLDAVYGDMVEVSAAVSASAFVSIEATVASPNETLSAQLTPDQVRTWMIHPTLGVTPDSLLGTFAPLPEGDKATEMSAPSSSAHGGSVHLERAANGSKVIFAMWIEDARGGNKAAVFLTPKKVRALLDAMRRAAASADSMAKG